MELQPYTRSKRSVARELVLSPIASRVGTLSVVTHDQYSTHATVLCYSATFLITGSTCETGTQYRDCGRKSGFAWSILLTSTLRYGL